MNNSKNEQNGNNEDFETDLKTHLKKFDDFDLFFKNAKKELNYYFIKQDEYKNIEDFKKYLIGEITFYVNSFKLSGEEKFSIMNRLDIIDDKYDKLIYFREYNPVEARRIRIEESNSDGKIKFFAGKIKKMVEKKLK